MPVSTEQALQALRAKRPLVVVDDERPGGHGDIVIAAEHVDAEAVNLMATHARGLICLCLTVERCAELGLRPQAAAAGPPRAPSFTESIEAREGITTGISAHDRALTVRVAIDPASGPHEISTPGHMFPLQARAGGVLERPGKTEAAIDFARLAGLLPAALICGIMNDDGTMAELDELVAFCRRHNFAMASVAALVDHRRRSETLIQPSSRAEWPSRIGEFRTVAYEEEIGHHRHLALIIGDPAAAAGPVAVHIHRACSIGDQLLARACWQTSALDAAMREIEREGCGAIAYLDIDLPARPPNYCENRDRRRGGALRPVEEVIGLQVFAALGLTSVRPLDGEFDPGLLAGLGLSQTRPLLEVCL